MYLKMSNIKKGSAAAITVALILGITGCVKSGPDTTNDNDGSAAELVIQPVEVIRPAPEPAVAAANTSVTLATNQYVYARLLTEELLSSKDSNLTQLYDQTLLAWDDAEVALAAAQAAIAEVDESGLSNKSDSGRAEGDSAWAEPFARALSPAQATQYLLDFSDEMVADSAEVGDAVWAAEDAFTTERSSKKDRDRVAREIERIAKVDVLVTMADARSGGTVGILPGSEAAAKDQDTFVVNGVDGMIMVSDSGQNTIMVADGNQVTVTPAILDGGDGYIVAAFGLLPVDRVAIEKRKVVDAAPLIGTDPKLWSQPGKVTEVAVTPSPNGETSVRATPVPRGKNAEETQQNLQKAGVQVQEAPQTTPGQVAEVIRVDPETVRIVIEILVTVVTENLGVSPTDADQNRETRPRRPSTTPPTNPPGPVTPDKPAYDVVGTYSSISEYPDGDSGEFTVEVTLEGSVMTLAASDGTVVTGTFDSSTQTFTGSSDGDELTLVFDTSSTPITAEGEGYSPEVGLGTRITMTKMG